MNFNDMKLEKEIITALQKQSIVTPTDIQQQTYPIIYEGSDLIARSQTGSGKTLAYLLPLVNKIFQESQEKETISQNRVLILVPTHELAMQVLQQIKMLNDNADGSLKLTATAVVGNVNITRQIDNLKKKPQFVVGTPGRMLELIEKKKIAAHLVDTIIVDEADKMLAKQQIEETKAVIRRCMRDVQKLFFSASMNPDAVAVAKEIAPAAKLVHIAGEHAVPDTIEHYYVVCDKRDKLEVLRSVISIMKPNKAIAFINRAYDIELATKKLLFHHYQAACIHGTVKKQEREKAIREFRDGKVKILVATDLASRGLDFEQVDTVIQYTFPENEKDYLHRAGRCGRNGKKGISISIVTPQETERLRQFASKLHIKVSEKKTRNGKLISVEHTANKEYNRKEKKISNKKSSSDNSKVKSKSDDFKVHNRSNNSNMKSKTKSFNGKTKKKSSNYQK